MTPVKHTLLLAVPLLLLLAHVGMAEVADSEELAIYRVLFSGIVGPVVLTKPDPEANPSQHDAEEEAVFPAWLKKEFQGVDGATIANYIQCRTAPALLNPKSDVGVKLVFVERTTLDDYWKKTAIDEARTHLTYDYYQKHPKESQWAEFVKRFSAQDYVQVSRVGFNAARTQALVSWYSASDEEVLTIWLEKQNGKWIMKDSAMESGS